MDSESGAATRKDFGFNGSAVLANDGEADTQPKSGASGRPFRRIERVKKLGQGFRADADTVVLNDHQNLFPSSRQANLDAAGIAHLPDGVLRVADEIEKDLDELIGVAQHGGKARVPAEVNRNVVPAKRMLLELQGSIDDGVEIQRLLLRRRRPRKFQQVLHDPRGAPGLAMRQLELPLRGLVCPSAFAKQFRDTEHGSERIIQFVRHASEHLSHRGKFLGLYELLLQPLELRDVPARNDHAFDLPCFVEERAEMAQNAPPVARLVADAYLE